MLWIFLLIFLPLSLLSVLAYFLWRRHRRANEDVLWNALVAEHATDLLSLHEVDTLNFVYASSASRSLLDYAPSELHGLAIWDIAHPLDLEVLRKHQDAFCHDGVFANVVWRMQRKNASWVWVESSGRLVDCPDGSRKLLWITRDVDERLRAEATLRESESRYRRMNAQISDVVWVFDVESKCYSYVSPSVRRLLGYGEEALQGKGPEVWMPSLYAELFIRRLEERLQWFSYNGEEKEAVTSEFPVRALDGRSIWIECRSLLAVSGNGRLEVSGVWRDITQRKEAEESLRVREKELQENNRIFMALLDVVQTRIFWKDAQGRYLGCNRAFAEDAGFTDATALRGLTDADVGWLGHGQEMMERDRQLLAQGGSEAGVVSEMQSMDGTVRFILGHRACLRDTEGRITGLLGTYSDITPLVLAERSLRDSERRYRHMVDHQADMILKIDLDGRILYASPSYCELCDQPLDELLGRSFQSDLDESGRRIVLDALRRVRTPPHTVSFELRCAAQSDPFRWIAWTLNGIVSEESGEVRLLVGSGRDITGQKGLLEEREKLLRQMENKNVELERIANLVTHDVKSALFNMAGFAQELKRDLGSGNICDVAEDTEQIIKAGDRLGRLLEAEIRLSRIGQDFTAQWFDVGQLARTVLRARESEFNAAGMEATLQISVHQAYGDADKVSKALQCLLDNALKFRGGRMRATLVVTVERGDGPGGAHEVNLGVHDNGIGVKTDFLPQMFELFNKQDPHTAGLGEGLALVRRVAELHGGRSWACSDGPGLGTSVFFTLPEPFGK